VRRLYSEIPGRAVGRAERGDTARWWRPRRGAPVSGRVQRFRPLSLSGQHGHVSGWTIPDGNLVSLVLPHRLGNVLTYEVVDRPATALLGSGWEGAPCRCALPTNRHRSSPPPGPDLQTSSALWCLRMRRTTRLTHNRATGTASATAISGSSGTPASFAPLNTYPARLIT
jgi:hypothetical protein